MSSQACGSADFCVCAGQRWSIREAIQLALAGNVKELSKPTYLLSLSPALDALADCISEGCKLHQETGEARELLAKLDAEYEAKLDDMDARAW
jgi:hypothetical protein